MWAGLVSETLWIAGYLVATALPPTPFWAGQGAFVTALGLTPRIALAGMTADVCGEFLNAYVLARLKVANGGRRMALRMVSSTVLGAGADTAIVLALAFRGVIPAADLLAMGLAVWVLKVAWEIAALPLWAIALLKRRERLDHFDRATDFGCSVPTCHGLAGLNT